MKKIEGKKAFKIHLINFVAGMLLWVIVGLIIGTTLGIWLENWFVFYACLIGSPFVFSYLLSSREIKKVNGAYEYMSNSVRGNLQKTDYFNSGEYGAIAVDVRNKEISVISADQKFKFKEPFVFRSEKIRNYKSYAPGYSRIEAVGTYHNAVTRNEILNKNLYAKRKAHAESGIYIDLDDITKPQVFIQMEYSEAEKWLLIIEKLLNGTLEEQSSPMAFPQQSIPQRRPPLFGRLLGALGALGVLGALGANGVSMNKNMGVSRLDYFLLVISSFMAIFIGIPTITEDALMGSQFYRHPMLVLMVSVAALVIINIVLAKLRLENSNKSKHYAFLCMIVPVMPIVWIVLFAIPSKQPTIMSKRVQALRVFALILLVASMLPLRDLL